MACVKSVVYAIKCDGDGSGSVQVVGCVWVACVGNKERRGEERSDYILVLRIIHLCNMQEIMLDAIFSIFRIPVPQDKENLFTKDPHQLKKRSNANDLLEIGIGDLPSRYYGHSLNSICILKKRREKRLKETMTQ